MTYLKGCNAPFKIKHMTLQERLDRARLEIWFHSSRQAMRDRLNLRPIPKWPLVGVHPGGAAIVGERGEEIIITHKQ